ncbi:type II toxin-antitoxin system HicA family toxin [Bacillus sp. PS06]|uniref:type II toxin-antitoxin system HicA family toxin n=1 Tax=Bacillus sp. PS06 TaxID=2764176 RepID=UPI00178559E4|nr:type II toxin-antitoxin system HicA family toxin [Bacillus sp. PS06]MBD8069453.1 type II toxin-antitoxin system HicA family toxin [Bacillus sp. PS06]
MASWKDLRKFLVNDGYVLIRHGRDDIYEKTLPNGEIKRVRVSKGTGEIGKGLFSRILKQQLGVDKEEFNERLGKKSK